MDISFDDLIELIEYEYGFHVAWACKKKYKENPKEDLNKILNDAIAEVFGEFKKKPLNQIDQKGIY